MLSTAVVPFLKLVGGPIGRRTLSLRTPVQSEVSEVCAVIERGSRRMAASPQRGAAPCRFLTTRHPARVACVPEGSSPSKPGVLAQEEPTIPIRGIGQGFGRPRAAARVHRARSLRPQLLQGKGAPRTDRDGPAEYDRIGFLGPSICSDSPNSCFGGVKGTQRPSAHLRRPCLTSRR
jgi:hypothetical protein